MSGKQMILMGALPAALILASVALSRSGGYLPSGTGSSTSQTRSSSNSCNMCHSSSFPSDVVVSVNPAARVMQPAQTIGITVTGKASSPSGTTGGFAADVSAGTLVAGTNSRVRSDGLAITHANKNARSWPFTYKASSTPGLVEFYTVAMASSGSSSGGDKIAFHGSSPSNTMSTPARFFVNAPGIKVLGKSCDDGYGNYSVFGAPSAPTIGNAKFSLEAHGLPPSTIFDLMLSFGGSAVGFDLAPLGAPGCLLWTKMQLELMAGTSPGNASRSEGKVILPLPLPNDPKLKGLTVDAQIAAVDPNPKRKFPVIVTNGIEFTIQ